MSKDVMTPGERELAEHGSIALRVFASVHSSIEDNTLDGSWKLTRGGSVLLRAKVGGFFTTDLQKDVRGWYVLCNNVEMRVEFDTLRKRWVVRNLPE